MASLLFYAIADMLTNTNYATIYKYYHLIINSKTINFVSHEKDLYLFCHSNPDG